MMNIAVFASGKGTNFSAILKAVKKSSLKVNLALLVCDQPKALVLVKARRANIKSILVDRKDFSSKTDFETKIIRHLKDSQIDLIVLAGFMRLLSPEFVREYKDRILNIHPSLLPAFKGIHGIKDAFDYGCKVTGVTVHFVDEELDHGPIILQKTVEIKENDTLQSLETRIHKVEHKIYSEAIKLVVEGKLKSRIRKVEVSAQ
jgi:phosphoribosylglycinamide formyltransferase-1